MERDWGGLALSVLHYASPLQQRFVTYRCLGKSLKERRKERGTERERERERERGERERERERERRERESVNH